MHIAASSVVNSQTKPYFTRSSECYKPIMKYFYELIQGSKYLNIKPKTKLLHKIWAGPNPPPFLNCPNLKYYNRKCSMKFWAGP